MLRTLIAAVTIYGYAQPGFDGYRPAFLEKPLQAFSGEINSGAQTGRRAIAVFEKARLWHYADTFIERVRAEWSAAKKS
jgi:hypothetical protein